MCLLDVLYVLSRVHKVISVDCVVLTEALSTLMPTYMYTVYV